MVATKSTFKDVGCGGEVSANWGGRETKRCHGVKLCHHMQMVENGPTRARRVERKKLFIQCIPGAIPRALYEALCAGIQYIISWLSRKGYHGARGWEERRGFGDEIS